MGFRTGVINTALLAALMLAFSCGGEGAPAGDSPGADSGTGWPEWIPGAIPVFSYGRVFQSFEEYDGGSLLFADVRMAADPYQAYRSDLLEAGWVISLEIEADETDDVPISLLIMEKGEMEVIYTFPIDGQGVTIHFFSD